MERKCVTNKIIYSNNLIEIQSDWVCYLFFSFILHNTLTCKPTCDAKLCSLTVETNTPPLSKQEIWIPNGSTDLSICTRRNSPGDGL